MMLTRSIYVEIDPIVLSLVAYVSVPFLSLRSSTVRSNPIKSTSSHCKISRSSWPNKTKMSEKKYEAMSNHAYKRSKKHKYFHGYKKIDMIINSKFIDPNKHTAKELHHMDLQETIVLRI